MIKKADLLDMSVEELNELINLIRVVRRDKAEVQVDNMSIGEEFRITGRGSTGDIYILKKVNIKKVKALLKGTYQVYSIPKGMIIRNQV